MTHIIRCCSWVVTSHTSLHVLLLLRLLVSEANASWSCHYIALPSIKSISSLLIQNDLTLMTSCRIVRSHLLCVQQQIIGPHIQLVLKSIGLELNVAAVVETTVQIFHVSTLVWRRLRHGIGHCSLGKLPARDAFPDRCRVHVINRNLLLLISVISLTLGHQTLGKGVLVDVVLIV